MASAVFSSSRTHRPVGFSSVSRANGGVDFAFLFLMGIGATASFTEVRLQSIGAMGDVLLLGAVGIVILRQIVYERPIPMRAYSPVIAWTGVLVLFGLVGTIGSDDSTSSMSNALRLVISIVGMLLVFADVRPTRIMVRELAGAYVFGATVNSAVAVFTRDPVTGRSAGWANHPNVLGIAAAFALIVLIALLSEVQRPARRALILCLPILLFGISLSGSRAAVLIGAVGSVVLLGLLGRTRWLLVVASGLLVTTALAFTGLFGLPDESAIGRTLDGSGSGSVSDGGRIELATTVLERIERRPVLGSGFARATEAHNVYLQVLDIAGVFGFIATIGLLSSLARPMWARRHTPICAAALAILASYLASGFFVNALWDRWLWFPLTCGLAAAVAIRDEDRPSHTHIVRSARPS